MGGGLYSGPEPLFFTINFQQNHHNSTPRQLFRLVNSGSKPPIQTISFHHVLNNKHINNTVETRLGVQETF